MKEPARDVEQGSVGVMVMITLRMRKEIRSEDDKRVDEVELSSIKFDIFQTNLKYFKSN